LEASRKYPFDLNECINFCLQEQWSAIFTGMSITSISLPCIGGISVGIRYHYSQKSRSVLMTL
jgi:hypothetical protein